MADTLQPKQLSPTKYIERNGVLEQEKAPFNSLYKNLAKWFLTRKQDFDGSVSPGAFLYSDIYDNAGEHAALLSASAFLSTVWPDAEHAFVIEPVEELKGRPDVDKYFRTITSIVHRSMDNPKSGLQMAQQEHSIDNRVFGISGIAAFENPDEDEVSVPVKYDQWDIKTMCIEEDASGFVNGVYFKREFNIKQLVEEYGTAPDSVHPEVVKKYNDGKYDDKIIVLKVIEKRPKGERAEAGKLAMAYRSLHIDTINKFIMREGGYEEMPVNIGRAMKLGNEKYGRSSAMVAFAPVVCLNAAKESRIKAVEKQLDPPLLVLDDGRIGGAVVDSSAGGITVMNTSGRNTGEKVITPLYTVGELQSSEKLEEGFKEEISQAFYIDRLLDLNNNTVMTAYETSVRNKMRGEALSSMFTREIVEVQIPLIERTVNIHYRKGLLGNPAGTGVMGTIKKLWDEVLRTDTLTVPADVVAATKKGLETYKIRFISPATRFMQAEKLAGIFSVAEFVVKGAPIFPGLADNVDPDMMIKKAVEYSGAPSVILRDDDSIKKIRETIAAQQQQAAKLEMARLTSESARNFGQAKQSFTSGGNGK